MQEGLTNIQKHANARQVKIFPRYRSNEVFLRVGDNGKGAVVNLGDLTGVRKSYGLFGLRERVQLFGGEMRIESAPGAGFRFEIRLPDNMEVQNDSHPHSDC